MPYPLTVLWVFLLLSLSASAQQSKLSGVVYDAASKAPLAFVSVVLEEANAGTVTDIDGRFSFSQAPASATLQVSYIGYKNKKLTVPKDQSALLSIFLDHAENELENVMIVQGENPAHRIIRLLQQNKKKNDPDFMSSFKYNAYTVAALGAGDLLWRIQIDTSKKQTKKPAKTPNKSIDSAAALLDAVIQKRFQQNYLMLTESYTERIFKYPKQTRETILATKISGLKAAAFAITSSNFQPFGFYKDYFLMGDKSYVNPVIQGSIGLYKFKLKETVVHEKDTTFIISFEPRKNKKFDGLKGLLFVNSFKYAIENVQASAADEKGLIMRFRLQQKYERLTDSTWFPSQLNTTISQTDIKTDSVLLYWDSRSYISNAAIGEAFSRTQFSDLAQVFDPLAGKKTAAEWNTLRADTLKSKEKLTYETYQMLPAKTLGGINKSNAILEALALEAIPWGKVDILFKYFISGINKYEIFRIGGGFQTNSLFNKRFSVGAFGGYGFGDKAWKYGGNILLNIDERTATKLRISFSQDIVEPGNVDYFVKNSAALSNQSVRNFYSFRMDSIQQYKIEFTSKLKPALQTNIWLLNELRNPAGYSYQYKNDAANTSFRQFRNTEIGIGFRITSGEIFYQLGRAKVRNKPPVTQLLLQVSKGLSNFLEGDLDYTKLAFQLNHSFRLKALGQTTLQLEAGQVWGNVPYAYLFNTKASLSQRRVSVFVPNYFQTVGLYDFVSDRSASLFIQQNFGNLLFKPKNIAARPEFILIQNIGFGSLDNAAAQKEIVIQTPTKGLYETGLLVKNIYRKNLRFLYIGFGGGAFYRYGYYALPKASDNWAFKFGVNVAF